MLMDLPELAARLADLRSAAGLTQAELADRIGVTRGLISQIEGGVSRPGVDTMLRWVKACDGQVTVWGRQGGPLLQLAAAMSSEDQDLVGRFGALVTRSGDIERELLESLIDGLERRYSSPR